MSEVSLDRSARYEILRTTDAGSGQSVVVKRVSTIEDGAAAWLELRNEASILERLQDVTGCASLIRLDSGKRHMVLEDFGGLSLADSDLLGRVDLETFLTLAERLAEALAGIHATGVAHKDINPGNVLVNPGNREVQIIDFGLATNFTDEHPEFNHHSRLRGSLAYLSPEQTGRMNRPVDYRTDLYALGCTLYQLATGVTPFTDTDPLTLIHAHLARTPEAPTTLAPWLPDVVSDLILDLLAKEPDRRYQSAAGVAADLRLCARQLARGEALDAVPRRQTDRMITPRPPRRQYGRANEIAVLRKTFAKTLQGGAQSLLVAGYSGVGKTSLVQELHTEITAHRGMFVSGKFDQVSGQPFVAPIQSMRQLCQLLLAEPEHRLQQWRESVTAALGADATALLPFIPELRALVGPQPPAEELGPIETQTRVRRALLALLGAVAAPQHPLVLFIDDLQWADQPSLAFLADLLQDDQIHGRMLIGAYRDNEVDAAHPLTVLLRDLATEGVVVPELTLSGLAPDDTADLLADMLQMPPAEVEPLADITHTKTGGNPFYTLEFLTALHQDGVLTLDPGDGDWHWDSAGLAARAASDSVVDFLAERLGRLDHETKQALITAACLGNDFDLRTLALGMAVKTETLAGQLAPALEQGIIVTQSALRFQQADPDVRLSFCHDRMQQAAYDLANADQLMDLNLNLARRLADGDGATAMQLRAARHYAHALPRLVDAAEGARARDLIAAAAVEARQAGAFADAEALLTIAIELLPPDPWVHAPTATRKLHTEQHLVRYCLARYDDADATYALLSAQADQAALFDAASIQVMSLSNRTRYGDAVGLARDLLGRLGIPVPEDEALLPAIQEELALFYGHVERDGFDRLPHSPELTDKERIAPIRLLSRVISAAFFGEPLVAYWCVLRGARLWFEEGYRPELNYLMVCVLLVTVDFRGDYATGYRAGRLSLDTGLRRDQGLETARVQHEFALFNAHWFEPLEAGIGYAREAHIKLHYFGEMELACYTFFTSLVGVLECGEQLSELAAETDTALLFTRKTGNRHAEASFLAIRQLMRALEGRTTALGGFDDADFSERGHLKSVDDNPMAQAYYHCYRGLSACLFGDTPALVEHSEAALALVPSITGFYPVALIQFLHALALAQQCADATGDARASLLESLHETESWLAQRAADQEQNFGHLHDLITAERCDLEDRPWEAHQAFERAVTRANTHRRVWHYALAVERFARFQLRCGHENSGRLLLMQAQRGYQAWGAVGKVQQMETDWPVLRTRRIVTSSSHGTEHGSDTALDHAAILLASQALASETSVSRLVTTLIEVISKMTGATKASFLLRDEQGRWFLEGSSQTAGPSQRQPYSEAEGNRFAASLMRLGLKTGKPVVSDDATTDPRFATDSYFREMDRCAVLGFPIAVHGSATAFLILENRLVRAAFSGEQVKSVELLARQLAISIENARMYESLEHKVAERTRELEASNAQLAAMSNTDGLTGIPNRRRFDETFDLEWDRCKRTGSPLSVALIDVDWFKKYNDQYGHQAGDDCLRQIARVLASTARHGIDLAARYGGEEFALIAPDTDNRGALSFATRICRQVEQRAIAHRLSPYNRVTVSIGVATFVPGDPQDDSSEQLLQRADAALYNAKEAGRNRVSAD